MSLEIERKFLLAEAPDKLAGQGAIRVRSKQRIEQTYLALDEAQEIRVRRITDLTTGQIAYTHTFKNGNGLSREEVEYSISEGLYSQLIAAFGFIPLTKTRLTAEWDDRIVEIDIYDQLELSVLEVEFATEEEAIGFAAPEWFGPDISLEKKYSNKTVWKKLQEGAGRPIPEAPGKMREKR
ncbi:MULTISPECIES: CYTH domain-containing protein [Cohnella]|uniref:CYTH domain-containing protein n=1 Tax=Cohnella TaxID=329857 RepID=UPI0009BB413E|nr:MULTISPECIES: CYTH domain-containing protein [Cohnella]MBN2982509.1 CYTH domain-containing protein [Cohnella algarum]